MDKQTVQVPTDMVTEIERRAEEDNVSESEATRQLLRRGMKYGELKQKAERLRRERRHLVNHHNEHQPRQAGLIQRAKRWLQEMV